MDESGNEWKADWIEQKIQTILYTMVKTKTACVCNLYSKCKNIEKNDIDC